MRMARVKRHSTQPGFTLIEMLIVITLIGILGAGALSVYLREARRAQVQAVRSQLVLDLQYARSNAQRYNCNWTVNFVNESKYELTGATLGGANINCATTTVTTRNLPTGIQIRQKTVSTSTAPNNYGFFYSSPFGAISVGGNPDSIEIGYATSATAAVTDATYVKIIGVTGKVISSAAY
jgi:prepilin-type N-terminal cleavage/methylation domain-containing protein